MHQEFLTVILYWLTKAKFDALVHQTLPIWAKVSGNYMIYKESMGGMWWYLGLYYVYLSDVHVQAL
jgi:hypothetical protein